MNIVDCYELSYSMLTLLCHSHNVLIILSGSAHSTCNPSHNLVYMVVIQYNIHTLHIQCNLSTKDVSGH